MRDSAGLEVLGSDECLRLLGSVPVGRVVFTEKALPAVHPVNFLVHAGAVIIRSGNGRSLTAGVDGAVVAFEVDDIDVDCACFIRIQIERVTGRRIDDATE